MTVKVKIPESRIKWKRCLRLELNGISSGSSIVDYIVREKTSESKQEHRFQVEGVQVCYVANNKDTAVSERIHSFKKFLVGSAAKPGEYAHSLIGLQVDKKKKFCDIRGMQDNSKIEEIYDENDYSKSQKFAKEMYQKEKEGIIYDSVRNKNGGECLAVFTEEEIEKDDGPIENVVFYWDGKKFKNV